MRVRAWHIYLNGIVQGVGFRPFVFKLAEELEIRGWVNNTTKGVNIHAEGENLEAFFDRLVKQAPPLAKINISEWQEVKTEGHLNFQIVESTTIGEPNVLISPDVATCQDCLKDILDTKNRRYHYPFTNCTNCGPRYTIIRDVPYDRSQTTMASFPMCNDCEKEYLNPRDRRFHAQPVACHVCGPKTRLVDPDGRILEGLGINELENGAILAVKGLGGFHLVCDAHNTEAVKRLRERKERGAKPFALMVRSVDEAREEVYISQQEEELLKSPAAPIVILNRQSVHQSGKKIALPTEIAPGLNTLGIMLPYTPLHHLLFAGTLQFLVMTSANLSGRPLIYENKEALEDLQGIADYFLLHDRDIYHPCDDSVVQIIAGAPVFHRRARGYVPLPLNLSLPVKPPLLAVGGELKNVFCLAAEDKAFVSQYLGDMEGYENFLRFHQELDSFQRVVNISPQAVTHDRHPNYQTTRFALESNWPKVPVQHHHAHLASALGENNLQGPALGLICDGTGYGEDGRIWGFEFLYGDFKSSKRLAHLMYLPLPGGDQGTKYPLRIAYAYAKSLLTPEEWQDSLSLWAKLLTVERQILDRQLTNGYQLFPTSSAGRLFDAVSALLGVCTEVTYEGQAAIELESVAFVWAQRNLGKQQKVEQVNPNVNHLYSCELKSSNEGNNLHKIFYGKTNENEQCMILDITKLFAGIVKDRLSGEEIGKIAYKFHQTLARAMVHTAIRLGVGKGPLVLNGGVFQNRLLTESVMKLCQTEKIKVLRAKDLPPGDGGLAFGQILIANEVLKTCV